MLLLLSNLTQSSKAKLVYGEVVANVDKISKETDLKDKIALDKVSKPVEVTGAASGHISATSLEKPNVVKLKIKPPSFSGKCRKFAVFKRDFETIVAVAGRSAVEIGESIPNRYRYLLDKVDL